MKMKYCLLWAMYVLTACHNTGESKENKEAENFFDETMDQPQSGIPEEAKIENQTLMLFEAVKKKDFKKMIQFYLNDSKLVKGKNVYSGLEEISQYWQTKTLKSLELEIEEIKVSNGMAYQYGWYKTLENGKVTTCNYLFVWQFQNKDSQWKIQLDYQR